MDAACTMKKTRQKKHAKNFIKYIDQKTTDEEKHPKTKSLTEFDQCLTCSIKSLAVKKKKIEMVKPTT